ncbi:hypothetical protein Tco_0215197 [Tanacetum coccineum]
MITKTSIMLGLKDTEDELKEAMADLRAIDVNIFTPIFRAIVAGKMQFPLMFGCLARVQYDNLDHRMRKRPISWWGNTITKVFAAIAGSDTLLPDPTLAFLS